MVVMGNQPRALAFGGAPLLHGDAWHGRERHVTHGADRRCGSSVVAVEDDAGAVDVPQRRPRVQVPALLAARSAASQIMRVVDHLDECFCRCVRRLCVPRGMSMSSSKLAKTEMWSGHPLLRREGRCRVARRMELGVELVSHLRDPG